MLGFTGTHSAVVVFVFSSADVSLVVWGLVVWIPRVPEKDCYVDGRNPTPPGMYKTV